MNDKILTQSLLLLGGNIFAQKPSTTKAIYEELTPLGDKILGVELVPIPDFCRGNPLRDL